MRKLVAISTACAALLAVSVAHAETATLGGETGTARAEAAVTGSEPDAGLAISTTATAEAGITDKLAQHNTAIRVTTVPTGTTSIHVKVSENLAGRGTKHLVLPATQRLYTPPAATPVVDVRAYGAGGAIGGWAGALQTVPAGEEPPKEEPPKEEPPEEPSGMVIGVDSGGWGGSAFTDLSSGGIHYVRTSGDHGALVAEMTKAGVQVASVIFGQGGTIGAINPSTYAAEIVSYFKRYGRAGGLSVELLNEANAPWYWSDAGNTTAYAKLAKAVHEGLATLPASIRPAELCDWDGGRGPSSTWGPKLKATGALAYCDGVTVHPYGGSSGQDGGALGGRADVEGAHAGSGLPVYITEIGWPTAVGQPATGDSQQWTFAQQAENITRFMTWARGLHYVSMVIYFNYVDYGSNDFYGIETAARVHKPSFAALAKAAAG